MKVYLASDHAGYQLKRQLKKYLEVKGYEVDDVGAHELDEDDDYPDYIIPCAEKVAGDKSALGIVIGGSGNGEAIVANKVKGIRAALFNGGDVRLARLAKEHNNANVLSLGARFISENDAKRAVTAWLEGEFEGGRHGKRIEKISKYEENETL